MIKTRNHFEVLLFSLIGLNGYKIQQELRKDAFPNNCIDKLWDFCWDMNSISRILTNEPVTIIFSEANSIQTISYDYQFLFMHYYSEYEREQSPNKKMISFKLTKSECSIPFIPNLENGYGTYTLKTNNKITTMQYYQYTKTNGILSDFYFNYIKKDIEGFFFSFESEFKKSLKNAKN